MAPGLHPELSTVLLEHRYVSRLREAGVEPRTRILIHGDPGNGKTTQARLFLEALGREWIDIPYGEVLSPHLGASRGLLRSKLRGRMAVLFDSLDERTLSGLVRYAFDAADPGTVIVVCSANPAWLDRSVQRRFQCSVLCDYPEGQEGPEALSHIELEEVEAQDIRLTVLRNTLKGE